MDTHTLELHSGGYRYENGIVYVGGWNNDGKRDGFGHLLLTDGTRYDGYFENGYFHGLGTLSFSDGAKYEGEFYEGWFHGYGIFWRSDGMRYEGQFCGGHIYGLGKLTFNDGSNGFPKHEGYFRHCDFVKRAHCPDTIQKAQKVAFTARQQKDIL